MHRYANAVALVVGLLVGLSVWIVAVDWPLPLPPMSSVQSASARTYNSTSGQVRLRQLTVNRQLRAPWTSELPLCTPQTAELGQWSRKLVPPTTFNNPDEIMTYFTGGSPQHCPAHDILVSSFGVMNKAVCVLPAVLEPQKRSSRALAHEKVTEMMSWEWKTQCQLSSPSAVEQVQWLVDNGGLLMVGDSVTRQHFGNIGCHLGELLAYRRPPGDQHAVTHDFFLDKGSSLLSQLKLTGDFDYDLPLISYQRADLLWSRAELEDVLKARMPELNVLLDLTPHPGKLYDTSTSTVLNILNAPKRRYSVILASSGPHYTPRTLSLGQPEEARLIEYFEAAMQEWVKHVSSHLSPSQRLLIRASNTGQSDCQSFSQPTTEIPHPGEHYNWHLSSVMQARLQLATVGQRSKQVAWLGGERPALLRPDGHIGNDCLHLNFAAGVFEVWSKLMWTALLSSHRSEDEDNGQ